MKPLNEYLITESSSEHIFFNKFDSEFCRKIEKNITNSTYPALQELVDPMLWNNYYTDYSYIVTDSDDGTITFVARTIFTSSITFKVAKVKLKSRKALTPQDLKKVVSQPASWGKLREFADKEKLEGCRVITCLLYNHYIGQDIDIPGVK